MDKLEIKTAQKNLKILTDAGVTLIEPTRNEIKLVNLINVFVNNKYSITISPPPGISKQLMFFKYNIENRGDKRTYMEQIVVTGRQSFLSLRRDINNKDYLSFGYHLFQDIKGLIEDEEHRGTNFCFDEERRLFIPAD